MMDVDEREGSEDGGAHAGENGGEYGGASTITGDGLGQRTNVQFALPLPV